MILSNHGFETFKNSHGSLLGDGGGANHECPIALTDVGLVK